MGLFLDTMRQMDYARFQHFCTVLKGIQANLEFSSSLSEYFATDDMLEPAILVVSETSHRNLNLQPALRGGSHMAHTLLYRHRATSRDMILRNAVTLGNFAPNIHALLPQKNRGSPYHRIPCRLVLAFSNVKLV